MQTIFSFIRKVCPRLTKVTFLFWHIFCNRFIAHSYTRWRAHLKFKVRSRMYMYYNTNQFSRNIPLMWVEILWILALRNHKSNQREMLLKEETVIRGRDGFFYNGEIFRINLFWFSIVNSLQTVPNFQIG